MQISYREAFLVKKPQPPKNRWELVNDGSGWTPEFMASKNIARKDSDFLANQFWIYYTSRAVKFSPKSDLISSSNRYIYYYDDANDCLALYPIDVANGQEFLEAIARMMDRGINKLTEWDILSEFLEEAK